MKIVILALRCAKNKELTDANMRVVNLNISKDEVFFVCDTCAAFGIVMFSGVYLSLTIVYVSLYV